MEIIYSNLENCDLKQTKHKIQFFQMLAVFCVVMSYTGVVICSIACVFSTQRVLYIIDAIGFFVLFCFANKAKAKYRSAKKKICDILCVFDEQEKIRNLELNDQDKIYLTKALDKYDKWVLLIEIRKQKNGCAVMHQFALPMKVLVNAEDKMPNFCFFDKNLKKLNFCFLDKEFEKLKEEIC